MRRVLVVDDEENIRVVLRTLLRRHGYEVETAASGEEALTLVDSFGPDCVLTDVRMPKMGGLDLLATLKAKGHDATVIVMSAYGNTDMAIEAMKAGAYDYVQKPFKPDEVVHLISPRPLLIIHAIDDVGFPYEQVVAMFEKAGEPKELIGIPDSEHLQWIDPAFPEQAVYVPRVVNWITQHLGTHHPS